MSHVKGMEEGYGMPIVIVTTTEGKTIYNNSKESIGGPNDLINNGKWGFNDFDISFGLSSFEYEAKDDDDHKCVLSFETQDENLPDNKFLQEVGELKVTWGYVGNLTSRTVLIQKSKVRYLADKIILELTCSSGAVDITTKKLKKAKTDARNYTNNLLNFIDWINIRFNNSGLQFVVQYDNQVKLPLNTDVSISDIDSDLLGVPINVGIKQAGSETNPIVSLLEAGVNENGGTTKEVIEEVVHGAEGGPWEVETRNKEVIIHNRDKAFLQPSIRLYVYRGGQGDLLNFVPQVSDMDEYIQSINTVTVDESKKEETGAVTNGSTGKVKIVSSGPNSIDHSDNVDEEITKEKTKQDLFQDLLDEYKKHGIYAQLFSGLGWNTLLDLNNTTTAANATTSTTALDEPGTNGFANKFILSTKSTTAIENTAVQTKNILVDRDRTKYLNYVGDLKVLEQMSINELRRNEMYATTAKSRVIGDPLLDTKKMITIRGVANKFAGKHYIMKAKHVINPQAGYYVDLETLGQSPNSARVLASFRNARKGTKDPKTGEYSIKFIQDVEVGFRDDFLLHVLGQVRSDVPRWRILQNEYKRLAADTGTTDEEISVRTRELKKLIVSYILTDENFRGRADGDGQTPPAQQLINQLFQDPDAPITSTQFDTSDVVFEDNELKTLNIFISKPSQN